MKYFFSRALFLLFVAFAFSLTTVQAQERNCSAMEVLEQQLQEDPQRQAQMDAIETHTNKYLNKPNNQKVNGVITIPTVVHVIYSNNSENISEAQIMSQMQVLNDDFRRLNADANGTWSQAADIEIEFCLATVAPDGSSTTGITRKSSSKSSWGTNDAMKYSSQGGVDAWPAGDYLNMWVCNIGGGILGYAQFPGSGSAATDGVVMSPQYFGTIGSAQAPFDGGRTTTHEVGHWLNLRHIWGDGNCNADDFVSDTPSSDGANYGCATGHVSCQSTDMVQNYMDYSDDACMNLFTVGQKNRMRALFDNGGYRVSLLSSNGCSGGGGGPVETCSDGIQNQGETGVDCGGPCAACPTACTDTEVTISITFDNYPEETSWTLTDASGTSIGSGGTYADQADGSTINLSGCLVDGCYDFTITDAYGDGICCSYGNGSYTISANGSTLASGGSFGASETANFCLGGGGGPVETCSDGIQNQGETGVDCGGPCSACPPVETCSDGIQNQGETGVDCGGPCAPCSTGGTDCGILIDSENFESGWGIWNDGGSDCYRNNYSTYASSGNYTIRIRDNSGTASSMTTDNLNLAGFTEVTVDFHYRPVGMESGEDFWLQGSLDGGSSWIDIVTWARGTDFNNNTNYNESIVITGSFNSTTKFRFRCDASANNDRIYIDDVVLSGCANARTSDETNAPLTLVNRTSTIVGETAVARTLQEVDGISLNLFPNPATNVLNVDLKVTEATVGEMMILDLSGKVIQTQSVELDVTQQNVRFNTSNLANGTYFLLVNTGQQQLTEKFVVIR